MIIRLSEQEIGEDIPPAPVAWADHNGDDRHLHDLVKRLSWRDAAVWAFIGMVEDIYGVAGRFQALRDELELVFARPVLSREQRRLIHRLCGNLVCSDVEALYLLTVGSEGQPLRSNAANLRAVLNELENLPARFDGLHPMVVFVEYLAQQVPEVAEQLHNWAESIVGTRIPLPQTLAEIRQNPATIPAAAQRYCLVSLDPDRLDPDQFYVSLAIQNGTAPAEPLRPPDDQTYSLAEIQQIIGRVLNDPEVNASAGLVIEFLLPMRLINLPVDEWPVSSSQISLGLRYPVVVRSLTRLRDVIDSFKDWRAKWAQVRETTFTLADPAVQLVPEWAQRDKNQLYARLMSSPAPVCLLMEQTPDPAAENGCDGLKAALQAGVPVLVWCHEPGIDITDALKPLLDESAPLAGLPQRLLDYRRQVTAGKAPEPGAPRITLLWDDASRIPDAETFLDMPA